MSNASAEDCYYFLQEPSQCTKGESCAYRHNDQAKQSSVICKFWMSGCCTNPACTYRHSYPTAPVQTPSTVVCSFYLSGTCRNGEQCPFLHPNAKPSVQLNEHGVPINQTSKPQTTTLQKIPTSTTDSVNKKNQLNEDKKSSPVVVSDPTPAPTPKRRVSSVVVSDPKVNFGVKSVNDLLKEEKTTIPTGNGQNIKKNEETKQINSKRTQQKNTSTKVETKSNTNIQTNSKQNTSKANVSKQPTAKPNTSRPTPSKSTFTPVSFGVFSLDQLVEKEKPNNNEETKKEEPKKSPLQTTQTKPIPSNTTKPKPTINTTKPTPTAKPNPPAAKQAPPPVTKQISTPTTKPAIKPTTKPIQKKQEITKQNTTKIEPTTKTKQEQSSTTIGKRPNPIKQDAPQSKVAKITTGDVKEQPKKETKKEEPKKEQTKKEDKATDLDGLDEFDDMSDIDIGDIDNLSDIDIGDIDNLSDVSGISDISDTELESFA